MPEDDRNINEVFLNESADDRGNARCLQVAFGERFLYCPAYGWMSWTGTHWQEDSAESCLDNAIFALLKRRRMAAVQVEAESIIKCTTGSTRRARDCKYAFKSLVHVDVSEFDNNLECLNVANGVVNLRTGELIPHDPSQRFTYCLSTPYDPKADMTEWTNFLATTVAGGEDILEYVKEVIGYSFTGYTSEECFWYIHGPTRSGKGVFTETLLALLPYPFGIQADFTTFTMDRSGDTQNFDLAPLKPARFIVASESRRYDSLNDAKIKSVTGGDLINCAFKYGKHFNYRPQFKILLVSNHPPQGDVDDDALWNRIKVLLFPKSHAGNEDKTLKARLKRPENLRGVLRYVVEGAMAWFASKDGLQEPWAVQQETQKTREELDHVQQWLNETIETKDGGFLPNATLYQSYENWCNENGQSPYKARHFGRTMVSKGFESEIKWDKHLGKTVRGYKGVIFRSVDITSQ